MDARATAWLAAWRRIESVGRFREEDMQAKPAHRVDEVPWQIGQLLDEARILAELARADQAVGFVTGAWLEEQERQEIKEQEHADEMMDAFREAWAEKDDTEADDD
jgi:hypothetical protein